MLKQRFLLPSLLLSAFFVQASDLKQPIDLDINVRTLNEGHQVNLGKEYKGKVILIVNTASKCAFTGQYEGLEKLYAKHKDDGLVVLGFPSNDFGNQEPGTEKQIQEFCRLTYGVQFPMFQKTSVTSRNADQLYQRLGQAAGEYPRWNFHKYLIDREGNLVNSFGSFVSPGSSKLTKQVQSLL